MSTIKVDTIQADTIVNGIGTGKPDFSNGLKLDGAIEGITTDETTTGTYTQSVASGGVYYLTANQTTNRTIDFTDVNSSLEINQSVTCAVLSTQGSTAYYFNAYEVDSTAVTPKWSGGEAPTEGNASGVDVYTFTIIKTADATFTVLASQSQYA